MVIDGVKKTRGEEARVSSTRVIAGMTLARVGQSDPAFDRRVVKLMGPGDHEP